MLSFRLSALAVLCTSLPAVGQDAELSVNNTFRVRSNSKNATTQNYYPASNTMAPGYSVVAGVAQGTRAWTHTPSLRVQPGAIGNNLMTITGLTQAIYCGAAVLTYPAPNHYQFRTGIALGQTFTGAGKYQLQHSTTRGTDIVSIADAAVAIPNWSIYEVSTNLTTPITVPNGTELCFFAEFRGGEYQDDPNNSQMIGCDYQGGRGPGGVPYWGWAVPSGASAYTVTLNVSGYFFRPKIGFLLQEPVLASTGHHANFYYSNTTTGEQYRGLGACFAPWSVVTNGDLFFDIRAGSNYGSTGSAAILMNLAPTNFQSAVQLPFGKVFLNPADPTLGALLSLPIILTAGGSYSGEATPIPVPPLGVAGRGQFFEAQGVVFNAGFTNPATTTASAILIE